MTPKEQLLCDLFTTALEGGINYWASVSEYRWEDENGEDGDNSLDFRAVIHDEESGDPDSLVTVTIVTMRRGYRLATGEWRKKIHWSSGEAPPFIVTDDTEWDFDAGDADCILQLGVFGEVVYG